MTTTFDNPVIEIVRTFDAPVERVFDAWLSKSWGDWAGPEGMRGEVTVMEPHVGGRYQMKMHAPDGVTVLTVGGTYKEVIRPSKLVMSWKWEHEHTETLVTLSFRAVGARTELQMKHEGLAADARADHSNGWNGTLDKLAKHLATA